MWDVRTLEPQKMCFTHLGNANTAFLKRAAQCALFFPTKCHVFHNFIFFGSYNIHVLHTRCAKI
jgi:hypothetical protein